MTHISADVHTAVPASAVPVAPTPISEPLSAKEVSLHDDVVRQFREDFGNDTDASAKLMMQQKYGLIAPILTAAEINLIRKEESRATKLVA